MFIYMNIKKFITNEKRSLFLEKTIITNPRDAYLYLVSFFVFDLVMLFLSIAGFFAIWMYKPDSILVYLGNSAIFVCYLNNVFSMRHYITFFILLYNQTHYLFNFYDESDANARKVIQDFFSSLPKDISEVYKNSSENF